MTRSGPGEADAAAAPGTDVGGASGVADPPRHALVRTRAGAVAVRSLVEGEVMHPGVGPRVEAEQLYVAQSRLAERLRAAAAPAVVVFDVGLGAGSNALAAWSVSEQAPAAAARLLLVSFERDVGALELALGHPVALGMADAQVEAARALLARPEPVVTRRSTWRLERGEVLESLAREPTSADIVFWDPFSPRANPGLWTVAAFRAARDRAGAECVLVTYSASTAVRVALLLGGWCVGVGEPIGDKAATTVAATRLDLLARPLGRGWLARLARPDAPMPLDAPGDAGARVAQLPQFEEPPGPSDRVA
jgi:queuine tRNA-ribosyltransferase